MSKFIKILVLILILSFVSTVPAHALNFGGMVTTSIFCTCSGNFLLNITPPVGGQFLYQPGTQSFLNFNLPRAGVWALGLYTPGGVCLMWAGESCKPFGAPVGTISPVVGTSL